MSANAVTEPRTKIVFADTLKLAGMGVLPQQLCGVGCRVKKIGPAAVNVYAVGMYVDVKTMKSRCGGKVVDKDFVKVVKTEVFDKTLVLKMARNVGKDKMVSALGDSVKPRMTNDHGEIFTALDWSMRMVESHNFHNHTGALVSFQELLQKGMDANGGEASSGMQFGFAVKGESLCVTVNGNDAGTVKSSALCAAMVDTYLDENAVSQDAKKSILSGMSGFLA
jgi:hypothetical protein